MNLLQQNMQTKGNFTLWMIFLFILFYFLDGIFNESIVSLLYFDKTNVYFDNYLFRIGTQDTYLRQFISMFTHQFMHGNKEHLFSNLFIFTLVSNQLEKKYDYKKIFGVFMISSFLTGLLFSILYSGSLNALVGSSCGVFGLMIYLLTKNAYENDKVLVRVRLFHRDVNITFIFIVLIFMELLNLAYMLYVGETSNGYSIGHIVGGMIGFTLPKLLPKTF